MTTDLRYEVKGKRRLHGGGEVEFEPPGGFVMPKVPWHFLIEEVPADGQLATDLITFWFWPPSEHTIGHPWDCPCPQPADPKTAPKGHWLVTVKLKLPDGSESRSATEPASNG